MLDVCPFCHSRRADQHAPDCPHAQAVRDAGRIVPVEVGPKVEAVQHHGAALPEVVPGEHCWVTAALWRVTDPKAEKFHLDLENLISIDGPGCFHCGVTFAEPKAKQPCPGDTCR